MSLTVYISGRITGLPSPEVVFDFHAARLRAAGFKVINPTDLPQGWTLVK
jgi:hypothetical protein